MAEIIEGSSVGSGNARTVLTERTGLFIVQISAWPHTSDEVARILADVTGVHPPEKPNEVTSREQTQILHVSPHRWLLVMPTASSQNVVSALCARMGSELAAVVEISAALRCFRISGPLSRDVLAKLLPIDLAEAAFPAGRCAQGAIGGVGVLTRTAGDGVFELSVGRSFAQHVWEVLVDATLEFA